MYEIVFTIKASDFVKLLQRSHKEKLKETLIKLKGNPFACPYKKIRGRPMFIGYGSVNIESYMKWTMIEKE